MKLRLSNGKDIEVKTSSFVLNVFLSHLLINGIALGAYMILLLLIGFVIA